MRSPRAKSLISDVAIDPSLQLKEKRKAKGVLFCGWSGNFKRITNEFYKVLDFLEPNKSN